MERRLKMSDAKEKIRDKFKEFVAVKRSLLIAFGPANAIYLTQLIDWEERLEKIKAIQEGQPFYLSSVIVEQYTGLDKDQQSEILQKLRKLEVVKVDRKGIPAKNYYTINYEKIEQMESQFRDHPKQESSDPETIIDKTNGSKTNDPIGSYFPSENITFPIGYTTQQRVEDKLNIPTLKKRTVTTPIVFESPSPQRYNKDVLAIIDYWNNSPNLPKHRTPPIINGRVGPPTKTFSNIVRTIEQVMKGNFFNSVGLSKYSKPYSKEEIISVIDKYKLIATSPAYLPQNKNHFKSIGLDAFFYNSFITGPVSSYFIKCLEEEPKPISNIIVRQIEKNPQLTIWLKEAYIKVVLSGVQKTFTPLEENKFIKGANQLHDLIRRIQHKLNMMTRPIDWCNYVIDSLVDTWGVESMHPGQVASEYTYSDILIKYMKKKGRIG